MQKKSITVSKEDREKLSQIARSGTAQARDVLRARIILGFAEEKSGYAIAGELGVDNHTVNKWRMRYETRGLDGLRDAPRSGKPSILTGETARKILDMTMHSIPAESTHWSLRLMGKYAGVSPYIVSRVWRAADLKPHLYSTFNFSKDPDFADKVIDIIGLYMNPHVNAIVLSVDEKTQIQALDHTQPLLQLAPGQVERRTHDCERHGTTSLYAAFDVMTGHVIGKTTRRHRSKEFVSFLNLIERTRSRTRQVHIILDNSSTHKTEEVREWRKAHPRYHFHFTPTSSSWLNAVENWFSRLERRGLRRSAFKSVAVLRSFLRDFIVTYNRKAAKPFVWTKDAATVLRAVQKTKELAAAQTPRSVL